MSLTTESPILSVDESKISSEPSTPIVQEELPPLKEQQAKDLLLAARLGCLCDLCYKNTSLYPEEESVVKEQFWLYQLGISEYKIWDHVATDGKEIATQALTGIFNEIPEQGLGKTPFICFRGTKGYDDVRADLMSLLVEDFVTGKANKIGKTGRGFLDKRAALLDLQIMDWCLEKTTQYGGLLVSGHSLGGALATLCSAELRHDHPEVFETHHLTLLTFGSPKVFDKETAEIVDKAGSMYRHIRFVNDSDVITMLPLSRLNLLYHSAGEVYFASETSQGFQKRPDETEFDFSPEPPNDSLQMAEHLLSFAVSSAGTHLMAVQRGYLDRLFNSATFQQALDMQTDEIKAYFKALPVEIAVQHEDTDKHLEKVKQGIAKVRENVAVMNEKVAEAHVTLEAMRQDVELKAAEAQEKLAAVKQDMLLKREELATKISSNIASMPSFATGMSYFSSTKKTTTTVESAGANTTTTTTTTVNATVESEEDPSNIATSATATSSSTTTTTSAVIPSTPIP